jgi:large subunit ribosomal protein L13Ae
MFDKVVVVDARGHLLGRLASYVAKQLLSGKHIIMKVKGLLLSDAKVLTLQDHSSEIKLSLLSF